MVLARPVFCDCFLFLATLVALCFTPVSRSVTRKSFDTSGASRLASLLFVGEPKL